MDNANLQARREASVARGISNATGIFAEAASNAQIRDVEGSRYIDFASGIAVLNVGHSHPRVMGRVREQLDRFAHTAFQVMAYEPYIALCERLNVIAFVDGPAKSLLVNSGAEAVENAMKIARAATGRPGIVSFAGAFHGRTQLACAMTGKVVPYKRDLGPFPGDVYHLPYPSPSTGYSLKDTRRTLDLLFASSVDPRRVAAIVLEPVQGEGGFNVPDPGLFALLDAVRREHGILVVADEVQTGIARTGRMFAVEHFDFRPDVLCLAKALGGGFPLAAVVGRAQVMDALPAGGLGSTYGGAAYACAAALEVLSIIEDEDLCARAARIGDRIRARVDRLAAVPGAGFSAARGLGAMIAFDVLDAQSRPCGMAAKDLCAQALAKGLLLLTCGPQGRSVRMLPPLTIDDATLDEGLDILEAVLTACRVSG